MSTRSHTDASESLVYAAMSGRSRVGALARRLAQLVTHAVLAEVQRQDPRIRAAHLRVFAALEDGPARAVGVARLLGATKQTVGPLIDELADWGYLERSTDPADARAKLVAFSERGLALGKTAAAAVAKLESRMAGAIGPDELEHCRTTLWRLIEAVADGESR